MTEVIQQQPGRRYSDSYISLYAWYIHDTFISKAVYALIIVPGLTGGRKLFSSIWNTLFTSAQVKSSSTTKDVN